MLLFEEFSILITSISSISMFSIYKLKEGVMKILLESKNFNIKSFVIAGFKFWNSTISYFVFELVSIMILYFFK